MTMTQKETLPYNTLYMHDGIVLVGPERNRIKWQGTIIPVSNCVDSRCAVVPDLYSCGYRASNRPTFHYDGIITHGAPPPQRNTKPKRTKDCSIRRDPDEFLRSLLSGLDDPEWTFWRWPNLRVLFAPKEEECDEDNNDEEEAKSKTVTASASRDELSSCHHELYFSNSVHYRRLVIGIGKRSSGETSFIEVGWLGLGPNIDPMDHITPPARTMRLTLARRYLPDGGDERTNMSFTALRSHAFIHLPPLLNCDDGVWSQILDFVGPNHRLSTNSPPWWSPILYGTVPWRNLQYENSVAGKLKSYTLQPGLLGKPPSPRMYQEEEPFQLLLSGFTPGAANTTWVGQCWGCGGPKIRNDLSFKVCLYTPEDGDWSFEYGNFCCEECVIRSIPEIARCSIKWKQEQERDYPTEASDIRLEHDNVSWVDSDGNVVLDSQFWSCLEQRNDGSSALQQMIDAGWSQDPSELFEGNLYPGNWYLQPEVPDDT